MGAKSEKDKKINVVDLFAGCGGLSLGFQNAGFNIVAAFDNWDEAISIYHNNFNHPIFKRDLNDVEDISDIEKFHPDIIIGGPPCQDYSSAGHRDEELGRAQLTTIASGAEDKQQTKSGTSKSKPIYFAGKRGQKIDLFRVIIALHECGFFSDGNGGKSRQEDVFNAFGTMLHEDFSKYHRNLHEAGMLKNDSIAGISIFDQLKESVEEYYNSK